MLRRFSPLLPAFCLGLVVLPAAAHATTITTAFTGDLQNVKKDSSGVIHLSKINCDATDSARVSFTFTTEGETTATIVNNHVRIFFSTDSSCPETFTATVQAPIDLPNWVQDKQQQLVTEEYLQDNGYNVHKIFLNRQTAREAAEVCPTTINEAAYICVRVRNSVTNTPSFKAIQFQLDTTPPNAPTITSVSPINAGLKVNWAAPTQDERPSHYFVTATAPGQPTKTVQVDSLADNANTSIKGLTNGVEYTVTVVATDDAGLLVNDSDANQSAPSAPVTGTPIPVTTFLESFADDTGQPVGGCSSSGATGGALLAFAALLLARRRKSAVVLTVALASLSAATASAAPKQSYGDIQMAPPPQEERVQSSRYFTFQLFTGPFLPEVDSSTGLNGSKPYQSSFGLRRPVITRMEFDVDVFNKFGRISLGGAAGFWQTVGKARNANTGAVANDTELFNLWPLSAIATYRADFLYERWHIPLVPYGKFGYGFVYYSDLIEGDNVTFTNPNGKKTSSSGWANGIEYAFGLQIVLDGFDRRLAAQLDQETGINTSSIFVEAGQTKWTGNGGLFLGGNVVAGGILFAF